MFGYCDVSVTFSFNANFIGMSILQKRLKSELYFHKNNLDKIESLVSESTKCSKSVKMLAITFKYD